MDDEIRSFTFARVSSILQHFQKENDINLYIFRSSGNTSMDEQYNLGEYNIYRLPDFSDFDGIIVDLNNVKKDNAKSSGMQAFEYVIEQIRQSGKPRISIANDIEGFYSVGIDNYAAMKTMIAHLHEVHQCRNFWGIMGPLGNFESQNRAQAIQDYMDEHKLPYTEDDFYFENYEYQGGKNGFAKLLSTHDSLPDAILCANDNIAVGVCEKARELGYHIPEDFKVTGFDHNDIAALHSPRISTVDQMTNHISSRCAEMMIKLLDGEEFPRINYTKTESIFWDSCGCRSPYPKNVDAYIQEQIRNDVANTEYNEQMKALNQGLVYCTSIVDICRQVTECISVLKDISLYLVLDEHLCDEEHWNNLSEQFMTEQKPFHTLGYPSQMMMVFAYEQGHIKETPARSITGLFPTFESQNHGDDFTFIPLHFKEYTVGYFVVKNGLYLMENRYLTNILSTASTAIENLYLKNNLKHANDMLSRLYIRDSMTGLLNRLGYQKQGVTLFNRQKSINENLSILFLDMDRLKYINDNYGHEYGDLAIKTISSTLFHSCPEGSIPIRWGGDEFLVIMPCLTPERLQTLKQNLRDEIAANAQKMQFPIPLTVSIGSVITDMTTDITIDEYIQMADAKMYAEKTAKKGF